ncbi:hypothetical protein CYMTET_25863 [Cymbomonas tetramitiformis]|uniref:Uncharacterized protein n=1 Tax=Cymbomonas tetramitiformis TaxID=36881 RepID=A0AAE0FTC4_9CHLO|nr:hypothetical protein CYMTET_25863 [Cymbomonas tetramitiformis]
MVDAEDGEGRTALTVALAFGQEEDGEGRTALTVALAFGQEAAARALLEAGAGVNAGTGRRPLHAAAEKGMVEMVRDLVDKGAEVDAEDGEGHTALTQALAGGKEAAARALLEAGAGVDAGTGQRPLHAAAMKGTVEMVRELVEKGAEVDAEDREGCTALTVALAFGQEAAARALLEAGAGVNAGTGRRPLHTAAEKGMVEMGMVEMVRELVEKSAEVDAEDGEGRTALTVALAFGQEGAARALLEVGAGVNAGTGQRAVHAAAEKGLEEAVRLLAGKGAEVDAEDGEGRTALTVALAFAQEGAARALLEAGAGVNAGTGRRPVLAAAERGMVEMSPMTDLFNEALAGRFGLREAQIHELRDLVRDGKVRLIFLLDAYDELKPQFQFKNLYVSNSLEQYQARVGVQDNTREARCNPKVIITVRTEMLANRKRAEYAEAFMPMEMESNNRAEAETAARARFLELRIAPFTNQVAAYIHAKVALEVRCEVERRLGPLGPLSENAATELCAQASKAWDVPGSVGSGSLELNTKELLTAASQAVAVPGGRDLPVPLELCTGTGSQGFMVAAVQAVALEDRPQDLGTALQELCAQIEKGDGKRRIWMYEEFQKALDAIPELQELTTTPFMVEIVTKILPELQGVPAAADSSMRAKLLLLLNEEAAQIAWGCISRWRLQGDEGEAVQVLEQVQKALSGGDSAGLAPLTVLANEVSEMLGSREILMKQSKLVEMAEEWLQTRMEADVEAALQDLLRDVAGGEMLQDLLRDVAGGEMVDASRAAGAAPEGRVGQLREATTLEEAIRAQAVPHALRSALRRPPVRRFRIYAMFLEHYVEREAAKARVTVKGYDSEVMRREGPVYAQRLALQMVAEGVSKVPLRSDSELFHRKSVWDPFLRDGGELREAAQKAAPVRCTGGVLSFIHKTVQEFLCAAGLRDALHRILRELAVPLEALMQQLEREHCPALAASEDAGVGPDVASAAGGSQEVDQATVAKALQKAGTGLVESEWAQVDLRQESVVRDFLADCVLDEPEFTAELQFLATWAELWCKGGRLAGTGGVEGGGLLGNVRAVLGGALPKRSGGALLHAAAADGSHLAVSVLLRLLREGALDGALLEQRDDEGRTPLFCAAQSGHAQVVAALLAAGARRDARSKLRPEDRPPVWYAKQRRHPEVMRVLIEAGADLSMVDEGGESLAHFAADGGHVEVLRALQDGGADLNHADKYGQTPAHKAAQNGRVEALRVEALRVLQDFASEEGSSLSEDEEDEVEDEVEDEEGDDEEFADVLDALTACDEALSGVEAALQGVRAAAAGCQSLAELASKLLRALAASLDETTIAEAAVRCALRELDALLGGLEERLRARLTEVLRKEEFASGLHLVFSTRGQAAEAAAGAPPPPDRSSATQPAASGCGDGSGLRDAARDSIVWLLSRVVLAELEPLRVGLRALDAFLGLSGARESAEEVTPAARLSELARLSMDLEREVSDVVRSEAEKHVGTDAAPLEQHQVEELVERLRASLPAVVGAGVAKSAGLAKSIAEKICADAVQMSAEALAGDRSEVPSVLQSGEVRLHVFVAHVDASVALLQRVSAGTAACEELLSARVQVPLRGVHARLSGEGPADAGAGTTWLPSFMQSRKKPPQGNGDEKAEALVARAWGGLAEALRGLDWALCKITGMEPASNRTEVGEDATCTAPLIMQAAGMREPHAGVPEQGTARAGTGLEQNNLPAALLQLSMHLVQAQALAGSLRAAARRGGLALTELAAGRRTGDVVKESLETAAKESLAAVRGCVQNVVKEMTVAAQEQLDCVAERCTAEVGEAAAGALGDTCGALVAPALVLESASAADQFGVKHDYLDLVQ